MVLSSQGSFKTLAEIGVATNRDGTLSINRVRLKSTLESDPSGVEALFNPTQHSSSPLVAIFSGMGKTKPGTYTLTNLVPESGGIAASGEFDGVAGTGIGQYLSAPIGSAAQGLSVEVKGAVASATVTVDLGLGGALQAIRDAVRSRTGPFAKTQERLSAETKAIAKDRAAMEARFKVRYDQLVTSFTAMERQVSSFKATQSYLDQQIKMWTNDNG
jgi:flagellar hook-associated protein 2